VIATFEKLCRSILLLGWVVCFFTWTAQGQEPGTSAPPASSPASTSTPASTSEQSAANAVPDAATRAATPASQQEAGAQAAPSKTDTTAETTPSDRSGAALRNENVFASKLDTESQKADDQRLGGSYALVSRPAAESSYYASEYGQNASALGVLGRSYVAKAWHADFFESLRNGVFNARTYFQVGGVKPSRMNSYGLRFSGALPRWGILSGNFGQQKNRGMVNGNILVPLPSERTPLATDPAVRDIVTQFIQAFPNEVPNRPDIDQRALNTNAPQTTDAITGSLRLDGKAGERGQINASHSISRQTIHAFQLLAGQNPDTVIHAQEAKLTYRYLPSEATELSFGVNYSRLRSDLHPEPHAYGATVVFGNVVNFLGPTIQYPLNRAENTFRYSALGSHRFAGSRHLLTFGGDVLRYQGNGIEQNAQRGIFMFGNNFGRTAMDNMLWGTPTSYQVSIGDLYRGFRTWMTDAFIADQWNPRPNLMVYWGIRHSATTAPTEVNGRDHLPFSDDRNNFSPRLAFAYRAPGDWIARGSYTVSYGQILPVTYSQIRYNAPNVVNISAVNPYLPDPLRGIDITSADARTTLTTFSPDMVSPYSHQYSFIVEHAFGPVNVDAGYLGSRTLKLVSFYIQNRAQNIPGITSTTGNINQRRPDQRYYDIVRILNGARAYLDAAQVSLRLRETHGLAMGARYLFSKALDQGSMYNSTSANLELYGPAPYQYDGLQGQKARSQFDSPHSLTVYGTYRTPRVRRFSRTLDRIVGTWDIAGTLMMRSGTPFTVNTGSDAPGFGNVDGSGGDRPDLVNPSILGATIGNPDTSRQILNASYFRFPALGSYEGNLGRNTFRRQAIANMNAAVSREWKWGGARSYLLRFQAEAFNFTNHPQFDAPQNNLTSPSFGQITNTLNDGRVLQFGLRFSL
jgi:hypothetical protein